MVKTFGSSINSFELEQLESDAAMWIKRQRGLKELDFEQTDHLFELFIGGINQINVVGTELLLGKIFDEIGFN